MVVQPLNLDFTSHFSGKPHSLVVRTQLSSTAILDGELPPLMLSGESVELLMHAELGVPGASEGQHLCRLAVRSTSLLVNRAVGQVELRAGCWANLNPNLLEFFIQSYGPQNMWNMY